MTFFELFTLVALGPIIVFLILGIFSVYDSRMANREISHLIHEYSKEALLMRAGLQKRYPN